MSMVSLHDIAPRIARARDGWVAEQARIARERARLDDALLRKQWLVDHRELQLLRAAGSPVGPQRKRRWVAARARKLEQARAERATVEAARRML